METIDRKVVQSSCKGNKETDNTASPQSSTSSNRSTSKVDIFYNKQKEKKKSNGLSNVVTNYSCLLCEYNVNPEQEFIEHYFIMHKKNIDCCVTDGCLRWFESQNGSRLHCKKVHPDKLKCNLCELVLLSPGLLQAHIDSVHTIRKFGCDKCEKSFTRVDDEKWHWMRYCPHNPDRVIRCKHCIKLGIDPDVPGTDLGLLNHVNKQHGMAGRFLCQFCNPVFGSQKKIDSHHTVCTKNKPEK